MRERGRNFSRRVFAETSVVDLQVLGIRVGVTLAFDHHRGFVLPPRLDHPSLCINLPVTLTVIVGR